MCVCLRYESVKNNNNTYLIQNEGGGSITRKLDQVFEFITLYHLACWVTRVGSQDNLQTLRPDVSLQARGHVRE